MKQEGRRSLPMKRILSDVSRGTWTLSSVQTLRERGETGKGDSLGTKSRKSGKGDALDGLGEREISTREDVG